MIDTVSNRFMVSSQFQDSALPNTVSKPTKLYAQLLSATLQTAATYQDAIKELTRQLATLAEHAFTSRRFVELEDISALLSGLPSKDARQYGLYYRALSMWRSGQRQEARQIVAKLTSLSPDGLKAKALLTLGGYHSLESNYQEASRFYAESLKLSQRDYITTTQVLTNISEIKSLEGDHQAAFDDLERTGPLVFALARFQPYLFYSHHNDLACELAALGRIKEAREHSHIACSSPLARVYTEWLETAEELKEPDRLLLVVPDVTALPEAKPRRRHESRVKRASTLILLFPVRRSKQRFTIRIQVLQPAHITFQIKTCAPDRAPPFFSEK